MICVHVAVARNLKIAMENKMNKWQKIDSKIVHQNPWYSVREDNVINPNGKEGKYYVVESSSVMIVAIDEDDKIYLVGQMRYATGNIMSWEIIGGGIKEGENALEVAKKELKEETGITADEWTSLGHYYPLNGICSEKAELFLAKKIKHGEQSLDETEEIIYKKFSLDEIQEMIKKNEISCGMTIAGIYKYLLLREK